MTLGQLLGRGAALGLERIDAHALLLHALGRATTDRAWLLAHDTDPVDAEVQARCEAAWHRRLAGEPLAYIVGRKEFHGLDLAVDARVLVPRPDTETLVDWALEVMAAWPSPQVVDLGTGSGAIALALKHRCPQARVLAVDRSEEALAVAKANGDRLGLDIEWRRGDWLAGLAGPFDVIVSNPPYIAEADPHLPALRHEPRSALAAGPDGLDDLRHLAAHAPASLAPGGWLLLEHGWDQADAVRSLLQAAGLVAVASRRDLAGIERCSGGQRAEVR